MGNFRARAFSRQGHVNQKQAAFGQSKLNSLAKKGTTLNLLATVKHKMVNDELKLHYKFKAPKTTMLVLFLIDSSGSMVQNKQVAIAKGVIEDTLKKNPQKKVKFGLVALTRGKASVECSPTHNKSLIINSLLSLETGGKTAMGDGLLITKEVINTYLVKAEKGIIQLFVFTDGKFNKGGNNPFEEAVRYCLESITPSVNKTVVIDTEKDFVKLGMAKKFAHAIGANYIKVSSLTD